MKTTQDQPAKPVVTGPIDGNIFAVLGACRQALERADRPADAKALTERVFTTRSYHDALAVCLGYVDFDLGGEDDFE